MADGNPYLQYNEGPGGTSFATVEPFDPGSPAIHNAAHRYAEPAMNAVANFLGGKNMLDSSSLGVLTEKAYRGGHQRASQDWMQQQDIFSDWALASMEQAMGVPPEREEPSFLQSTATGALAGGSIGGPVGAGVGALAGAANSLFDLGLI